MEKYKAVPCEPEFLKTGDPTLFTNNLLNLQQESEEVVTYLQQNVRNQIDLFSRYIFYNIMQDIGNKKLFVLFEPQLNCNVATDHLAPKSVLPLFADALLDYRRLLGDLLTHGLSDAIEGAIYQIIKTEVNYKLIYEYRVFYQTHYIDMLIKQLDYLYDLLLRVSTRLSAQAIDEIQLIYYIVEQARARMRIGFVYQSDFRDLKFDTKEKENSGNEAANRVIKKLSGQVARLKAEIARLSKENDRVIELKIQLNDREKAFKDLQKAFDKYYAEISTFRETRQKDDTLKNAAYEYTDTYSENQSNACGEDSLDDERIEALNDSIQQLNLLLCEQKKDNLRIRYQYELEIERLTNINITLQDSTTRPPSAHSSCSYHGSRASSAKKGYGYQVPQYDYTRSQLAKYQRLFYLLTGFDVGAPTSVDVVREVVNYNLSDELLQITRYMFYHAVVRRETACYTAGVYAENSFRQQLISVVETAGDNDVDQPAAQNSKLINCALSSNGINRGLEPDLRESLQEATTAPQEGENQELKELVAAYSREIYSLKLYISYLIEKYAIHREQSFVLESQELKQHDSLMEASHLLGYTKHALRSVDASLLDKAVQTGLDEVYSGETIAENKRQRMIYEAEKLLYHSELTKDVISHADSAFSIYYKLFRTYDKITKMEDELALRQRYKAQIEYERILKAYRVHIDQNVTSLLGKDDSEVDLQLMVDNLGGQRSANQHCSYVYNQEVRFPALPSVESSTLLVKTASAYAGAHGHVRKNSIDQIRTSTSGVTISASKTYRQGRKEHGLDCNLAVTYTSATDEQKTCQFLEKSKESDTLPLLSLKEANQQEQGRIHGRAVEYKHSQHETNLLMSVNTKSRLIMEVKEDPVSQKGAYYYNALHATSRPLKNSRYRARSYQGYLNDEELFTAVLELQTGSAAHY